jgi:hypothetical protein
MTVKHVLLVWELGGNRGHVERLQVVAHELKARGVRCTFVVRVYASTKPWLEHRGWDCVQAPDPVPDTAQQDFAPPVHCHADWFLRAGFHKSGMARQLIDEWAALWARTGADAAILDYAPSAAYALHFLGLPFLTLGTGFCTPSQAQEPDCFSPWDAQAKLAAQASHRLVTDTFLDLRRSLGSAAPEHMLELFTPQRVAMCTFAPMDHWARPVEQTVYHGVIWSLSHQAVLPWYQDDKLLRVFCYLNAEADFVMSWLQALHALKLDVIAVTPGLTEDQILSLQRPGLQLSRTPLDMATVLKECGSCITQGGLSVTAASLWYGVPLLILPRYAEQALLARRLTMGKLAASTVQSPTPSLLADKLAHLQGSEVQAQVQAFAAQHASYNPQRTVETSLAMLLPGMKTSHDV